MPQTSTIVIITALMLVSGGAQVLLFKILSLDSRGFIKSILGSMAFSGLVFALGLLWTFGIFMMATVALYAFASVVIPILAYVRKTTDMLDLDDLVKAIEYTNDEVHNGRA